MESVSTFFRIEDDIWYRKGEAVGVAKGEAKLEEKNRSCVETCIAKGFSDEVTAEIAGVDLSFVKEIRISTLSK